MNAERLLQHYERIADAPNAIARLRRFILDLAVRGKLAPQDPHNPSPVKLLAKAREELRLQAETAQRMRWKESDAVAPDEIEKDVPQGWVAARVNDTGLYINGLAFKPADWKQSGIPIIRIQNLTNPQNEFNYAEGEFPDEVMVRNGDLLVSWSATLEAFKWERGEGVLNQHIFRVIPHPDLTDRDFLLLLLRNAIREMADSEHAHGLVMAHINRGPFLNHVLLIPPLAEQRRIVAKVDELMALCDQLEAARKERERTRDRLAASSLVRLNAPDPATFQADARFALNALPALTTRSDQIKQLRQTILNLAVRGKLVPQDGNDEPISATLNRAMERRAKLVQSKKVRAKKIDALDDLDVDASLPSSWVLGRLGSLVDPENTISYGVLVPGEEVPDGIPFVRAQDLALSGHPERPNKTISPEIEKGYARTRLRGGEILVCVVGSIGKLGIVPQSWAGANIARAVARILPIPEISREYLLIVLRGEPVQSYFHETTRTLAQPTLNVNLIEQTPIPLPPLAEQHRIVAKVDALMALCDRLEASLTATAATRRRLLDALLAEALAPAQAPELEAAE